MPIDQPIAEASFPLSRMGMMHVGEGPGGDPKSTRHELWARFRSAIDEFYARRKEHFAHVEREREDNLRRKKHLVSRAESLASSNEEMSVLGYDAKMPAHRSSRARRRAHGN